VKSGLRFFACPENLTSDEPKRRGANNPRDKQDNIVIDEVGIDHQRQAEDHRFPEMHSFAVNERDKTDRAEEESTN
jgi:hypothetical protein